MPLRLALAFAAVMSAASTVLAQTPAGAPAKQPPPLWDAQIGASFIGTSGNTDTSSAGLDFSAHRRGLVWQLESTATAIRASDSGRRTAERLLGAGRVRRSLTDIIGLSAGERAERDRLSGIDFRSILDGGLSWKLVRQPSWTLDGVTGVSWNHESRVGGGAINDAGGVLQVLSRIPFGNAGDTTQRFTFYPDFRSSTRYRQEAEVTAQAAMAEHLALRLGYLLRYSNDPVPGFKKTDNTATASVVLRWKADSPSPTP